MDKGYDDYRYEQDKAWGEEQAYQDNLSAYAEYEAKMKDEEAREMEMDKRFEYVKQILDQMEYEIQHGIPVGTGRFADQICALWEQPKAVHKVRCQATEEIERGDLVAEKAEPLTFASGGYANAQSPKPPPDEGRIVRLALPDYNIAYGPYEVENWMKKAARAQLAKDMEHERAALKQVFEELEKRPVFLQLPQTKRLGGGVSETKLALLPLRDCFWYQSLKQECLGQEDNGGS